MYCYGCEYCQERKDQQGWWFHICTHPTQKGRFSGEIKQEECPTNRQEFNK